MRLAIVCLAAGLGFFALALLSIKLTRSGGRIAAIWMPNAIAVGLLLRFRLQGQRFAIIAMAAGNIAANLAAGDAPVQALLLALANTTEIALAVALARRWCEREPLMEDTSDLTKFVVAAAICGPIASGIIAVIALHPPGLGMLALFAQWVTSDALSMLVLAPSVMIAIDAWRARRRPTRREVTEWTLFTGGGTSATLAVFTQTTYPLLFLIPPVVVAHSFRLGSLGTAFSTIKVAIIALVCTELGLGPINLVAYSTTTQLLVLEAFLASALVVGLPISAILATRERIAHKLVRQRSELALLAENLTDAILRVDPQGICTYASPSTTAVLGIPAGSETTSRRSSPATVAEVEDRRKSSGNRRRAVDRAPPRRGRILLAEDHDINRMLVTAMLEDLGQDVAIAEDGVAAIEMACEAHYAGAPFDLVLMDIQMPGCDGYAATRAIRADGIAPTALPIVALTANAYPEDIAAARDAGMQAHLSKPLIFEDLAAALARWLPMRIVASGEDAAPAPTVARRERQAQQGNLDERWKLRRSEAINAVSAAARGGALDGSAVEELARTVHKLAGTAGMFGEEELGARAAALERALRSGVTPEVRLKLAEELLQAA